MPLITDLQKDFTRMAPGIEADALKAQLHIQLAEYIDVLNKMLAASNITLRLHVRDGENDEQHISFVQFGREEQYAKVKFDVKKEEASLTPDGKRTERLNFDEFKKRLLHDLFARLDTDERSRFAAGFRAVLARLEKPKALALT